MADSTRSQASMRDMEERLEARIAKRLELRLVELAGSLQKKLGDSIKQSIDELIHKNVEDEDSSWKGYDRDRYGKHDKNQKSSDRQFNYSCQTRLLRIDFPRFAGENVKEWVYKCETYFMIDDTPEEVKVKLAIMHFEGKALKRHHAYVKSSWTNSLPSWNEYVNILVERFGDLCDDPMADLMKLRHKGTINDYHEEFDAIITRLDLPTEYTLSCFLGGLRNDIQMMVRMFQPPTVRKGFALAKLYEYASGSGSKIEFPSKSKSGLLNKLLINTKPATSVEAENSNSRPRFTKNLSPTFMNERRAKGLCYFCDEPYSTEHGLSHKTLHIHLLEVEDSEEEGKEAHADDGKGVGQFEAAQISVNALTGIANFRTMRVTGRVGCRIEEINPLLVTVADGTKVKISYVVRNFTWTLQHTTFTSDVMLIPLGCCDVVLGIEWLVTLGDIIWNFDKLSMEFSVQGRRHVLRGASQLGCKTVKNQQFGKILHQGVHLSMIQVGEEEWFLLHSLTTHAEQTAIPSSIEPILQQYADVFSSPTQLPPIRVDHDHKIPLLHNTDPVNKRPYRYAKQQKDIIDKLVQEMLDYGVIQNSNSPYASPVVLVGKKDGTWRLCVDYRELNKGTIKDIFPIPLVDDLMDELHGSAIFSKIDLRAGYHQVRMSPMGVDKTTFRTHSGHFEYLVMPFGLTNAPATFQSLMNSIFKDFLRNGTIDEHIVHLERVLAVMRQHHLLNNPNAILELLKWNTWGYGTVARPLTKLLKKDNFKWTSEAKLSFQNLKDLLTTTHMLALPNFTQQFILEVDASGQGIGDMLMQNHHPIAFISRVLNQQQQVLSTYEKELLDVVFAVHKWRHYLLNKTFIIRTGHRSLKYIMDQRLTTAFQQKWLVKLMEFDFSIEYKQGRENLTADALSRVDGLECQALFVHTVDSNMIERIEKTWFSNDSLQKLISQLQLDTNSHKHYTWNGLELRRKGKLVVGKDAPLR
ncbi:PREDICTED: uncharacterized protein LOC109361830 [Lupinus angustifolius]|uniref:uncharacterized protein LOC109361830 n=1 Tax=Lupinus angustifolius TaxID=3871 RepID=UPI00092F001F|nr:PREDICTED: uncharacterized protein LOC109361830 [Lupinus angustifolius]